MRLRQLFRSRSTTASSLLGGLGNQMFQYAAGRTLARHFGHPLVLDTTPLHRAGSHTPRAFELNAFRIEAEVDTLTRRALRRLITVQDSVPLSDWPQRIPRGSRLDGYWQNPAFFAPIRQCLLNEFALSRTPGEYPTQLADQIRRSVQPVSVHFRRGDYVNHPTAAAFHGTCSPEYYEVALGCIRQQVPNATCFVFSDDPDWVRAEARLPESHVLVDSRRSTSAEDIWLMSLCRHHVVANSSFSWWGAWLSQSQGLKIAPKRWFIDEQAAAQERLVPPDWRRL